MSSLIATVNILREKKNLRHKAAHIISKSLHNLLSLEKEQLCAQME
jgi:hypothetical protein